MSNDKLFGEDNRNEQTNGNNNNDNVSDTENYMEMYVGEGKKYSTAEEALKALHHAQVHIPRVEDEARKLREELASKAALEDLVDRIQKAQGHSNGDASNRHTPDDDERYNEAASNNQTNSMSREDIDKLVRETLLKEQQQSTFDKNIDYVAGELEKQWGPGYKSLMTSKAREMGMKETDLLDLAGKSPTAFLNAVGANERKDTTSNNSAPPRSTAGVNPNISSNNKSWDYYRRMRTENPTQYWSPKTQNEIYRLVESGVLAPQ